MAPSTKNRLIKECDALLADICMSMFNSRCCKCGREGTKDEGYSPHHIIRKGMGGANIQSRHLPFNVVWTCPDCHTAGDEAFHRMARQHELNWLQDNCPEHYKRYQDHIALDPLSGSIVDFLEARKRDLVLIKEAIAKETR